MAALIFATASFLPTGPLLRSPQRTVGAPRLELQAGDFVVAPIEPPSEIPSPPVGTSLALDCLAAGVLEPELASAIAAPENVSVTLPIEIPPHCAPLDPSTGLLPPGIELPVPIPTNAPMPELSPPPFAPKTELPSLRDLAAFCLPTLGIWLSSPLLSLIDTSVVGLTCATHHLAALAPSTKLCDYVAFFCSVIGGATTNLAAEALAKGQPGKAKRIIGSSLTLSLVLGAAVAVALGLTARPIMAAMLGGAGATSAPMLTAATDYTTIRALGYPAALLTMTLQSAFIATKDSRTPLLAVPLAAFVNLAADLVLVRPMGAAGAAWATTLALYANAATLLAMWSRKLRRLGGPHTHFAVPSGKELQDLIAFALPMMVALIARVVLGMSITLSAVALGTTALAANQVIESLYWLFCPFGEAISLCMQAYLPPLLLKGRSLARRLQQSAFRAAAALGALAGAGAVVLPLGLPGLFTTSAAVSATCAKAAPMLGFGLVSYVLACSAEGMLVARKQLRFLATAHVLNAIGFGAALRFAVRTPGCGLHTIWALFGLCNLLRLAEFTVGLRREDMAHLEDRAQEPRRWRRALRNLRSRVSALRSKRREEMHDQIPSVADLAPHLLGD